MLTLERRGAPATSHPRWPRRPQPQRWGHFFGLALTGPGGKPLGVMTGWERYGAPDERAVPAHAEPGPLVFSDAHQGANLASGLAYQAISAAFVPDSW
jgi:hypothetical protein